MFLSLAENIDSNKKNMCQEFSRELGKGLLQAFSGSMLLTGQELRAIEWARKSIVKKLEEEWTTHDETNQNIDNLCSTYLNKAVRELNLAYLEYADDRYFKDKNMHATSPKILLEEKYIDYEPIDFQQNKKEDQGIEYYYNPENKNWDYKMGILR